MIATHVEDVRRRAAEARRGHVQNHLRLEWSFGSRRRWGRVASDSLEPSLGAQPATSLAPDGPQQHDPTSASIESPPLDRVVPERAHSARSSHETAHRRAITVSAHGSERSRHLRTWKVTAIGAEGHPGPWMAPPSDQGRLERPRSTDQPSPPAIAPSTVPSNPTDVILPTVQSVKVQTSPSALSAGASTKPSAAATRSGGPNGWPVPMRFVR